MRASLNLEGFEDGRRALVASLLLGPCWCKTFGVDRASALVTALRWGRGVRVREPPVVSGDADGFVG